MGFNILKKWFVPLRNVVKECMETPLIPVREEVHVISTGIRSEPALISRVLIVAESRGETLSEARARCTCRAKVVMRKLNETHSVSWTGKMRFLPECRFGQKGAKWLLVAHVACSKSEEVMNRAMSLGANNVVHMGHVASARTLHRARTSARMHAIRKTEAEIDEIAMQRKLKVRSRKIVDVRIEEKISSGVGVNQSRKRGTTYRSEKLTDFIMNGRNKMEEQVVVVHVVVRGIFECSRK